MKKKIVFGITSLGIGGAERVLVDISNELSSIYDITIFTLYGNGFFENELNSNIKVINLYKDKYENLSNIKKKIIPLYVLFFGKHIFKKYIKNKFDVEVSFLEGPITRIFASKSTASKIAWIHNDISKVFGNSLKAKIKLNLDKKIYSKYQKLIFVSKDNQKSFNDLYKIKNTEHQEVIYNYINKENIIKKSEEHIDFTLSSPSIVVVSRLVKQKAIDRLITVHKQLIDNGINNNIYIIGDGPEKENLLKLINELQVQNTFNLLGAKTNPYPYIKNADYFALLSYFEGYGMVIEEAKILNKKIIITDTAAKEAVKNYFKKVILNNDTDSIYNGLKNILQEKATFDTTTNDYDNNYLIDKIKKILGD